ncbi:SusC/RagA family TonB-linked outer membrane protein [Maribellus comscasis]|nr:SusC/RagA family TonB-linked outer membrane protein [Maribellus comscasis]
MKLTFLLILISFIGVFASESYSQTTKLTLSADNLRLEDFLVKIENQSEFRFFYTGKIDVEQRINGDFQNKKITEILEEIENVANIKYEIMGRQIILSPKKTNNEQTTQQQKTVSGRVIDSEGQPLPGVTVVVKGTTQGTVTSADGEYSLSGITTNVTLQFSFVGMKTQEILAEGQTTINVRMEADAIGIEEVVAIGYGTQKKVNMTGAVDVVTSEKLTNRQAPTVSQLLQGISPGMNFEINNQEGFQPGATMDISIRGTGSLNGGEPYILIDGIPGDINNLNPEDIESISVLKDAAASAIYGARAPYGVILVTTKKGEKDKKLSVTYSANVSLNTPQPLPQPLDSYTWVRALNEAGANRGGSPFSNETIERIIAYQNEDWDYIEQSIPNWPEGATIFGAYPNGNTWDHANLSYANNNWWDIFYGHSINHKHDLSFHGGSKNASYYFSAGYLSQEGVLNYGTDTFDRINLMGKVNLAIADWWDFSWETRVAKKDREKPSMTKYGDYSFLFGMISSIVYPISPMYDGWGNYTHTSAIPMIEQGGSDTNEEIDNWNNFKMEFRPLKGWKINVDFAYNSYSGIYTSIDKNVLIYNVDKTTSVLGKSAPNSIERTHTDNKYWTTNIYSSYEFSIKDSHHFNFLAGMQFEKGKYGWMQGYKTNLIVEDVSSLQTATGSPVLSESLSHMATEGYFSRLSYNYKGKYLLESNVRYDGSYVFREDNRWGFFPSFSAGWNIHNETFWNVPEQLITTLKIRGSWGQLGNQNVSPYSDLELVTINTDQLAWVFNYGETRPVGFTQAPGIVNRNLTWETATTKNVGMNISFLDNRLQTDFDLYERLTTDMVGASEAKPGVLGASVPQDNNSSLRTRGWELTLSWKDNLDNGLSYFVNFNLYDYKSVVTKYFNPTGTLSTWYEGQELGEIWGYTSNDLFRTQEDLDAYLETTDLSHIASNWNTGDIKYEDTNNDGYVNNGKNTKSDHGDLSIIGNSEPHWQYGIMAGMEFKGFDFSMLWKGVAKKDIYFSSGSNIFWGFMNGWWETQLQSHHLDYFRDEAGTKYSGLYEGEANINTDAYWPRPYLNASENNKNKIYPNTRYLQNASWVRLQNIQIGYTLPDNIISKLHLQKMRVYFSGENLLTFSDLPNGIDPVAPVGYPRGGSFQGTQGEGRLTYGADRIFSLGLTITY